MSRILPFAASRDALMARLAEQLPPSSAWAGRLMLLPDGVHTEPMPATEAAEVLRAFRAGLSEAIGTLPLSYGGQWVTREDCVDWDGLLAPLATAATYIVGSVPGARLAVEIFRHKGALAGWGVRGMRGLPGVARAAGFAVIDAGRSLDGREILLDRVVDTFCFVLRSQGEPTVEADDLDARLARKAIRLS